MQRHPFITDEIEDALQDLRPGEMNDGIAELWRMTVHNPSNELLRTLAILQQKGMTAAVGRRLIRALVGLHVDPTNPWTSSYVLSDILGYLSVPMLGEVLSHFNKEVREVKRDSSVLPPERDFVLPVSGGSFLMQLKREHQEMRQRQRAQILSNNPARNIAEAISRETNQFLERAFQQVMPFIFDELRIPQDSDAILYFADMKTFASDFDFLYWGPKQDSVRRYILNLLSWLGIKSDAFAVLFLEDSLRTHAIDEYVYHSFNFKGVSLAFGEMSFRGFHDAKVNQYTDLEEMWRRVYPYMNNQLAIWNEKELLSPFPLTAADIKKLYYRSVFNLI